MKKYFFEAAKKQLEKPTEPNYIFCKNAEVAVVAEDEAAAKALACEALCKKYCGTGVILGEAKLVNTVDLAVDWSYGYGDERKSGDVEHKCCLLKDYVIR